MALFNCLTPSYLESSNPVDANHGLESLVMNYNGDLILVISGQSQNHRRKELIPPGVQ